MALPPPPDDLSAVSRSAWAGLAAGIAALHGAHSVFFDLLGMTARAGAPSTEGEKGAEFRGER